MIAAYRALDYVLTKWNYRPEPGHTGSYNCRPITGGTSYSLHAYLDGGMFTFWSGVRISMALAVDINWQRNPYGPKLITDMPRGMVEEICAIRTNNGVQVWGWGGYYSGNKDAMHYELRCTPADLRTGIRGTPTPPDQEDDMADYAAQLNKIESDGRLNREALAEVQKKQRADGPHIVVFESDKADDGDGAAQWFITQAGRLWLRNGDHAADLAHLHGLSRTPEVWNDRQKEIPTIGQVPG